jgi:hypothetical protein
MAVVSRFSQEEGFMLQQFFRSEKEMTSTGSPFLTLWLRQYRFEAYGGVHVQNRKNAWPLLR